MLMDKLGQLEQKRKQLRNVIDSFINIWYAHYAQ